MSSEPQSFITARIAESRADLATKERRLEEIVIEIATAQAPKELEKERRKVRAEIESLREDLSDYERAREHAEARDSKAKALQRFELAKQARTRVDELGVVIEAEIEKVVEHIDGLRSVLANIEAVGQDRANAAYTVIRECCPDPSREWQDGLVGALKGQPHAARIVGALYASGLGRVGPWLAPFLEIAPARNMQSAEEINHRSRNLIAKRLGTLLKRREAALQTETQTKEEAK